MPGLPIKEQLIGSGSARSRASNVRARREMVMISIGIKGLAKFMTSGSAAQRKVLWDYKHPDPEGRAQAKYYRDARNIICEFHGNGRNVQWLESQGAALSAAGQSAPNPQIASRLKNNARAIKQYAARFSTLEYELLPDVELALIFGSVRVLVNPDLHVREKGKEKLIKLDFSDQEPKPDTIKVIAQGIFEAALVDGFQLSSSQVLYVDVPRGVRYKAARLGARVRANIQAACQNIEAIWPTI
jgi:hypothetical protein